MKMKNIFTKTLFLLSALPILITGCNKSENSSDKPDDKKEPSLTIDVETLTIEKFESAQLTYTLLNSDATVSWASSNSSIATIDQDGNLYACGVGSAYISATAGDLVSSCTVTVTPSTIAPTLVYDTDEITMSTEDNFEQDLYVSFKGEFVFADISLALDKDATTGLIEYSYDAENGRLSISSKQVTGSTVLVAGIEIYDTVLSHKFVVTIL